MSTETSTMNWSDQARDHVKDRAEKKSYVKVGLYFPSHLCNDLDRALALKLIDKKTFLIIVEGDKNLKQRKKNLKKIREFLTKHKLTNVHIHSSRVHTLKLDKVLDGRKIDLLFFDICGNYTSEIANWFNKYQDCFAYRMALPMTIAIHPRGKQRAKTPALFKAMNIVSNETLRDLELDNIPNSILDSEDIDCLNLLPDIRQTVKSIYYTFSRRELEFKNIEPYRFSRTNMVGFEVIVGREKDENSVFESMLRVYDKKVCPQKQLRKERKTRQKSIAEEVVLKTANDIARYMGIYGTVSSLKQLPGSRRAWVTMNAKKAGLDPDKVKVKIERRLQKYGLAAA